MTVTNRAMDRIQDAVHNHKSDRAALDHLANDPVFQLWIFARLNEHIEAVSQQNRLQRLREAGL